MAQALRTRPLLVLGLLALGAPSTPGADWTEVKSPYFVVRSDAGSKDARRIALRFEQIRAVLQQRWPWARLDPGRVLLVVAARDASSFEKLLPTLHERKGQATIAGVFQRGLDKHLVVLRVDASKGDASGYFANPYHTIYHEYVHLVLALNFGDIPAWLSEGLAEYWGDAEIDGDRLKLGQPIAGHVMLLRQRDLLPPEVLLGVGDESPHYWERGKAEVFYAQSWALVHYLINETGRDNALDRYVRLLKQGTGPTEAAKQALPDPKALAKGLDKYLGRLLFNFRMGKAPLPDSSDRDYAERRLSPAEVRALQGELLARFARSDAARAEARRVLEEAGRLDPTLAAPQETLGLLAFYAKDFAIASSHLARAAELQSANAFTHYLRGLIALRIGSAPVADAEAALERATQLNPDFAPAYTGLAEAAARAGAPLEKIEPIAQRAIALEPGVPEHRLSFAWILWQTGRLERARTVAEEALRLSHDDNDRALLRAFLDDLSRSLSVKTAANAPAEACEKGDGEACMSLALSYRSGKEVRVDPAEAARFFEKACDAGKASGCAGLGWALERGEGLAPDEARAVTLYGTACEGGEAFACARLALLLESGRGKAPDLARAAALFARACGAGDASSCARHGAMLEAGRGVPADPAAAAAAYARSCEGANAEGCARLGRLQEAGRGVPRDGGRALASFEKACELKPETCTVLASALLNGSAGPRNEVRALEILAKSCDRGMDEACTEAGLACLRRGTDAAQREAHAWFTRACDAGEPRGCHDLAELLDSGLGTAKDSVKARAYYRKACQAGYEPSCQRVGSTPTRR